MNPSSNSQLGPYELQARIGAGGMGEVYQAWDSRLRREVAIKILPVSFSTDPERIRRFEIEARAAAALNHLNVLAIFDFGTHEGAPYLVSELLLGQSLRERLKSGPLSRDKSLDFARQIAAGLSAAHAAGIVHRDIKPENLFVTREERIKILDFGLAKVVQHEDSADRASTVTGLPSGLGAIKGTVGYMSPEQVRGMEIDRRSDIFSFGTVLYEMITGRTAFSAPSAVENMYAVLRDTPSLDGVEAPIARVILHCMEKAPEDRFQSVRDLQFALEGLDPSDAVPAPTQTQVVRRARMWAIPAVLLLCVIAASAAAMVYYRRSSPIAFRRLTFRRGRIQQARFTADGNGAIYSAQWEDQPTDVFDVRFDNAGSRSLGFSGDHLAGLSPSGDVALIQQARALENPFSPGGMLARAPLTGGSPRALEDRIDFADFVPAGDEMAVARETEMGVQLEFPIGHVVYKTPGFLSNVRVSPSGDAVAFIDHPLPFDNRGSVASIDRSGKKRTLTPEFGAAEGLAWLPDGKEIWFTAAKSGSRMELSAVTLAGKVRLVLAQSGRLVLQDISKSGAVLLSDARVRTKLFFHAGPGSLDQDISWLDWTLVTSLSRDGKLVAFFESGEGAGAETLAYTRETGGGGVVLLGPGRFPQLSLDGRAVTAAHLNPSEAVVYPVGPGRTMHVPLPEFEIAQAGQLSDPATIWFNGNKKGESRRFYLTNLTGQSPSAISPVGVTAATSPLLASGNYLSGVWHGQNYLFPLHGGDPRAIPGSADTESYVGSDAGDRTLYTVSRNNLPAVVSRVDMATGQRTTVGFVHPSDAAGIRTGITRLVIAEGGSAWAYSFIQELSELYRVEGLK